jgi:hypothetical protein
MCEINNEERETRKTKVVKKGNRIICTYNVTIFMGMIKSRRMREGACSSSGGGERRVQGFGGKA